ncbi:unnamed protein product [Owenia fusiformis]|uniref:Uncharacterized protein n=1 Tax=Owenia fusiformis TaxID=6347 RepID=A0A8J1Y0I6_OWEFU|nr:unnamed protein product [Owenia fusiformis]
MSSTKFILIAIFFILLYTTVAKDIGDLENKTDAFDTNSGTNEVSTATQINMNIITEQTTTITDMKDDGARYTAHKDIEDITDYNTDAFLSMSNSYENSKATVINVDVITEQSPTTTDTKDDGARYTARKDIEDIESNTDEFDTISDPYENSTATGTNTSRNTEHINIAADMKDDGAKYTTHKDIEDISENNTYAFLMTYMFDPHENSTETSITTSSSTEQINETTDMTCMKDDGVEPINDTIKITDNDNRNENLNGDERDSDKLTNENNVSSPYPEASANEKNEKDGLNVSTSNEIESTKTNETVAQEHTIDDYLVYVIFKWVFKITMPLCLIIGIPGNILNITILCRNRFSDSSPSIDIILMSLAVSDIISLAVAIPRYIISYVAGYDFTAHSDIGCKLFKFLNFVFSDFSSWLVMLISLERLVAVVWPCHVKSWCSHKKIKIIIATFLVFLIGINFHFLLGHGTVQQVSHTNTQIFGCSAREPEFMYYHAVIYPWIDFTVFALIPISVVVFSNMCIIRKVSIAAYQRRKKMAANLANPTTFTKKKKPVIKRVTIMMFLICGFMLLAIIPSVIYEITFASLKQKGDLKSSVILAVIAYYAIVSFYCNCSINFLLYVCCSQKFKLALKSFFCRCTTNSLEE